MMKRHFLIILLLGTTLLGNTSSVLAQLKLSNPLSMEREELIEVPYARFLERVRGGDSSTFCIRNVETGEIYPYQLETPREGHTRHLLIWARLPASGAIEIEAVDGKPAAVSPAVFARYVPERMDDFAWENDRIAFRIYGPALEGTPGDADGIDVWVKRTDSLIVNAWYAHGDYHRDHGQGLDYYSVGHTLGAGDAAPVVGDFVVYPKHYVHYRILDRGPLRTTFELHYAAWTVQGRPVEAVKTIRLDKGAQLNKITLRYHFTGTQPLNVAAGIARRSGEADLAVFETEGRLVYWEPETAHGHTGVGLVFPEQIFTLKEKAKQYLAVFNLTSDQPASYYAGAVWDRAGRIRSMRAWEAYLKEAQLKIQHPIEVTFK